MADGMLNSLRNLEGFLQHQERGRDLNGPDIAGAVQIGGRVFRITGFDRIALSGARYFKLVLRPDDGAGARTAGGVR